MGRQCLVPILALLWVVGFYAVVAFVLVRQLRARGSDRMKYIIAFAEFWIDFIVGDDWRIAAGRRGRLGSDSCFGTDGDSGMVGFARRYSWVSGGLDDA
jgi:hypothetical protein